MNKEKWIGTCPVCMTEHEFMTLKNATATVRLWWNRYRDEIEKQVKDLIKSLRKELRKADDQKWEYVNREFVNVVEKDSTRSKDDNNTKSN